MRRAGLMLGFLWLALAAVIVAACAPARLAGRSGEDGTTVSELAKSAAVPAAPPAPAAAVSGGAPPARPAGAALRAADQVTLPSPLETGERMIVRNASLVLLVDDVQQRRQEVQGIVTANNALVVSSAQRDSGGRPLATITIRVPAERFDDLMEQLRGLAVRVNSEEVTTRDVTEEYVDAEARLRNLRATEARYLELLQQARTVEDVLKVEQQLSNIRGQIEQLQGRLELLRRTTETSLVNLELRPYIAAQAGGPDWSVLPILAGAWAALLQTLQALAAAVIWLLVFAPLWAPLVWLTRRWRRQRAARRVAVTPGAPASPAAPA